MADGDFGPAFLCTDGHHLELDDEFAFSLWETLEEWRLEQAEICDFMDGVDEKQQGGLPDTEVSPWTPAESATSDDEFASPWNSPQMDWPLMSPGPMADLAIAFRLAEMVSALKEHGQQTDVDRLNEAFRKFRQWPTGSHEATKAFVAALEGLAGRHEFLVAMSADLQSKLHELSRQLSP